MFASLIVISVFLLHVFMHLGLIHFTCPKSAKTDVFTASRAAVSQCLLHFKVLGLYARVVEIRYMY